VAHARDDDLGAIALGEHALLRSVDRNLVGDVRAQCLVLRKRQIDPVPEPVQDLPVAPMRIGVPDDDELIGLRVRKRPQHGVIDDGTDADAGS
jgi:hypothetical protein